MNKEVLKVLENDARATAGQISTMTGLSARQVRKTIEEAEDDALAVLFWLKGGDDIDSLDIFCERTYDEFPFSDDRGRRFHSTGKCFCPP